jgi:hypothetical protein
VEDVEDRYESAMASHLVAFAGITSRSASNEDGNPSESILEAFNESGDLEDCDGKAMILMSMMPP